MTPSVLTAPSRGDLASALSQLRPARPKEAVLHLALPRTEVVGISARSCGTGWAWRDAKVASKSLESAALLARLGWQEGDRFLDLNGSPTSWVKPIRSGVHIVVFGADVLFDLPKVLVEPSVTHDSCKIVEMLDAGDLSPGKSHAGLYVDAAALGWIVRPAATT